MLPSYRNQGILFVMLSLTSWASISPSLLIGRYVTLHPCDSINLSCSNNWWVFNPQPYYNMIFSSLKIYSKYILFSTQLLLSVAHDVTTTLSSLLAFYSQHIASPLHFLKAYASHLQRREVIWVSKLLYKKWFHLSEHLWVNGCCSIII